MGRKETLVAMKRGTPVSGRPLPLLSPPELAGPRLAQNYSSGSCTPMPAPANGIVRAYR